MNHRLHFSFALSLAVITAALTLPARSAEAIFRPVNERRPLRVGAPRDAYPYSYVNEQGNWDGFSTEILDAVARVMNLPLQRTPLLSREIQERFERGEFDLNQHMQQTSDRERFAEFTVPLLTLQGAIFVRRGGPIKRLEDLNGADFAIFNVNSLGERFLQNRGLKAHLINVDSPAAALKLVDEGGAAGTFVSQLTALAILRRDGLHHTVTLGESIEGFDVRHCIAVHKGDAQLLARLNEGLAILHQTGEFDRIHRKWFGQLGGAVFTREEVVTYVAAALALALAATTWGFWRQRTLRRHIELLNAGLEQRVTDRTAELNTRVAEVEHLNQELEAFSYSVSHDLRAPLRNITGFLELLTRRTSGRLDAEESRFVSTVTKEAGRMGKLIDDLLALSQIGRAGMELTRVALDELVAEIRAELSPEIGGRAIEWKIDSLPAVRGDRALLRQVFSNLLSNAVKFTRQRAAAVIEVGVMPGTAADDGFVTIFVRDNGAGFNPKYADKLFGVFQRLHNARDFEGTGIGLANVKRIVTRHGGQVWGEGSVDNGAVFYLKLKAYPQ